VDLPIGYDNFREIIENKLDFVDKSLLIKEILNDKGTKVVVITRPRRFGKTFNLSMLHHFLAADVYGKSTKGLFDNLKITRTGQEYMKHQGKYPVIFLTLKGVKDHRYETAYDSFRELIRELYSQYRVLQDSPKLYKDEKEIYASVLKKEAPEEVIKFSLKILTEFLARHYGVSPWLLIDEYDTPIQASYVHGYYEPMLSFIRGVLGEALKSNPYLHRAVMIGILRIAKESLFSGVNNLKVYSLLNNQYSQYFGFTEAEVNQLLEKSNLQECYPQIRDWYNGYRMGETVIYNPWSIVNCIQNKGELRPYWVNTSDNRLIKDLMIKSSAMFKVQFELLLQGKPVNSIIDENFAFDDLDDNESAIWGLLLFSGYLKTIQTLPEGTKMNCTFLPPNQEVTYLYQDTIKEWFTDRMGQGQYHQFLKSLLEGEINDFTKMLKQFLLEATSVFDVKGKNPERFYHGFVLGLVASLGKTHVIKSNHESGYGRYDVMIIPKDIHQLGIILEFKSVNSVEGNLEKIAHEALMQITERKYETELLHMNITRILKMGLAFRDKDVCVVHEQTN
jgi:Predicted AAA-ATPase/PD-(D/E)XK nuclease superfamily